MTTIHPHINFNGNAQEAFDFYKSVFGGEFRKVIHFKDVPGFGEHVGEGEANKLMHIALPIGPTTLIGNDVPAEMGTTNENENRSKIFVSADTKEEADRIFNGLSAGGAVEMPMAESTPGSYFAMFRDKYGIEWEIEFNG